MTAAWPRALTKVRKEIPREAGQLFLGVFFTFAPIGPLLMMLVKPPGNWAAGVVAGVIAGVIAMCWAFSFIVKRYWLLAIIIPLQVFGPRYVFRALWPLNIFKWQSHFNDTTRLSILALMALVFLVTGYIFTVRFVRSIERESARAKAELDLAASLHAHLVPDAAGQWPVASPRFAYIARSVASTEMGGDLVDVLATRDRCDIMLADVSGHGVKAGVVMAMFKSALRMRARTPASLGACLSDLSEVLEGTIQPGMFVTAAALRLHVSPQGAGYVEAALAGHPPILHYRARTREVVELPNQSLPLGIASHDRVVESRVDVHAGDLLMLYTDGLNETLNAHNKMFGIEALHALLARAAQERDLDGAHDLILRAVAAHGPQTDDRTLVLVRALS